MTILSEKKVCICYPVCNKPIHTLGQDIVYFRTVQVWVPGVFTQSWHPLGLSMPLFIQSLINTFICWHNPLASDCLHNQHTADMTEPFWAPSEWKGPMLVQVFQPRDMIFTVIMDSSHYNVHEYIMFMDSSHYDTPNLCFSAKYSCYVDWWRIQELMSRCFLYECQQNGLSD